MTQELVLVTGGAGFIGSHVVGALLERGHRVPILDNFRTGKPENIAPYEHFNDGDTPQMVLFEYDLVHGMWPTCKQITDQLGPIDRIIHMAAQTSVLASVANPVEDAQINYVATIQLLEYARVYGVKKLVMASSAAVYGDVDAEMVSEDLPTRPLSPYGIHKRSSELQMAYYHQVHGVASTALRFFNAYGPRLDDNSGYASVIPIFMRRALAGLPLLIFGDGEQTRDFVFVEDIARALIDACWRDEGNGEAVNVGTGTPTTINELAALILSLGGASSAIEHLPARPGEIIHSCCDCTRAEQYYGFSAETSLEDGLRRTLAWHQSRRG